MDKPDQSEVSIENIDQSEVTLDKPVHGLGAGVVEYLLVQVRHLGDHADHLLLTCRGPGQEGHLQD